MDPSPVTLAKILLPKTPLLLKTAVMNTLSLSPNASKQDLRTELTVTIMRELLQRPTSIGRAQKESIRDPGIKGKMWISKVTLPEPEDTEGVTPREAIAMAIKELGDGSETYTLPEPAPIEAEWTGYRSGVDSNTPRPDLPEPDHYNRLMSEVKSDVVILYFHGGGYFFMDPASHRMQTSNLAKLTSGRVLSVRYRLAPQNPFPTPLLDALIAYLSLISPPPGSLHTPIAPSNIVFAGDSAGGNLCLCLLLLLLTLLRSGQTHIRLHNTDIPISLPAGLALNSPWADVSCSLPSCHKNAHYDYISPPAEFGFARDLIPDDVWPAQPPRVDLYVNATALMHPLVSPLAAEAGLWASAPPVYMCVGNEMLEDEICVLARRMQAGGAKGVRLDGYEGMPHCFGMILMGGAMGRKCMGSWAGFIKDVVEGKGGESKATWAKALSNPVSKVEVEFEELKKELSDEEVARLMGGKRDRCVQKEEGMVREWRERGGQDPPKSKL